jgi:hypothetical protein
MRQQRRIGQRLRQGLLLSAFLLSAECVPVSTPAQMTGADRCQGQNPAKQSAVINCSGTGECKLVDTVANQSIQVCAYSFDLGGTTPSAEFDYGTQAITACDTSAAPLTGAMTASKPMAGPLDYFTAPTAKQLCLNLAGTNPTAVGVITYVQK